MAFAIPSLDKVKEIGKNEDDQEDLEVRLASFSHNETSSCTTAIPQKVCPKVVIFVFSFILFRYNR